MQRNNLITAVEEAALNCGLCFYTGHEYQLNEVLKKTPSLWLSHPEAIKHEGMSDGIKTYALKIFIIDMPDRHSAADPEPAWEQMEAKATKICALIAETECVKSISDIEMTVAKNSITNRGEISITIKMKVHVPFFNPKNQ